MKAKLIKQLILVLSCCLGIECEIYWDTSFFSFERLKVKLIDFKASMSFPWHAARPKYWWLKRSFVNSIWRLIATWWTWSWISEIQNHRITSIILVCSRVTLTIQRLIYDLCMSCLFLQRGGPSWPRAQRSDRKSVQY